MRSQRLLGMAALLVAILAIAVAVHTFIFGALLEGYLASNLYPVLAYSPANSCGNDHDTDEVTLPAEDGGETIRCTKLHESSVVMTRLQELAVQAFDDGTAAVSFMSWVWQDTSLWHIFLPLASVKPSE